MNTLTRRYTDEAIGFIRRNKERPFFIYIPHSMPHTKLGVSDAFRGKSERGLYGDVIEEIDWNVGRILDCVKELDLDKDTYILFTSDNGPWWIKKEYSGSASPLRGAKTSAWEGGLRVPCVMRAPGRIPAGTVCNEIASTLDILPTLTSLAGAEIPSDRVIDGHDISDLIHGKKPTGAVSAFYYYVHTHLQAVRCGKWKLHLSRPAQPPWCPKWARHIDPKDVIEIKNPMLFNLENDIGETTDVAHNYPDVVRKLFELAEWARNDIGDYDRIGQNARFYDPHPRRPDSQKWQKQH
jgi:arylsulfatase